jgi:hypothetical protein
MPKSWSALSFSEAKRRPALPSMERVDTALVRRHLARLLAMLANPPDWLRVATLVERWPSG